MAETDGLKWQFFPKSSRPPSVLEQTLEVFRQSHSLIDSAQHVEQSSNEVLAKLRDGLVEVGFEVEAGKKASEKIRVPVLYGSEGRVEKSFEADAWHKQGAAVLEVEAGRAFVNNQFLKDLFQACVMQDVEYLAIAVRKNYRDTPDYRKITEFIETLYASEKLFLPLKGILIIGY